MSAGAKARNMEKLVAKAKREDKRSVQTMAVKKGGGSNSVNKKGTKLGKNVKTKVVDRRLKSDKRGLKRADNIALCRYYKKVLRYVLDLVREA